MIEEKIFPNFWQALLIIACWAITNSIVFTTSFVMVYDHNFSVLYYTIMHILVGLNYVPYIIYLKRKANIRIWDNFALPDFNTLLNVIIVTTLLSVVIRIPLDYPVDFIKLLMESQIKFRGLDYDDKFPVIVLFFTVILFPIAEEILYRGLILKQFLKRYSPTKAIILSSLIFSFAHLNIERFFFIFILGLILGIFYYKTNSILVASISHWIFNTAVIFKPKPVDLYSENVIFYSLLFIISIFIVVKRLRKPAFTIKINELKNKFRL